MQLNIHSALCQKELFANFIIDFVVEQDHLCLYTFSLKADPSKYSLFLLFLSHTQTDLALKLTKWGTNLQKL